MIEIVKLPDTAKQSVYGDVVILYSPEHGYYAADDHHVLIMEFSTIDEMERALESQKKNFVYKPSSEWRGDEPDRTRT
jgi:hypothetical protein